MPLPLADFYSDPEIYDILHTRGTAKDVAALARLARAYTKTDSTPNTWLEPACGSARYLRVAAKHGVNTIGFDQSPAMIAYAQGRAHAAGLSQTLFVADMETFASAPEIKPA